MKPIYEEFDEEDFGDSLLVEHYKLNDNNFMEGKKTYTFLLVAFLGWLGVGEYFSEGEAGTIVDAVLNLVGFLGAVWGRYVAKV